MAGLTIDAFTAATVPLSTGNLIGIGQGVAPTQTYKADIIELQKYIQRQGAVANNNPLGQALTLINGYVNVTVATNNLTISIMSLDGDAPSANDPVFVIFRNATLTNGGYVVRALTAAVSFTINSPNTLGIISGQAAELLIVAVDNGGAVQIGAINPNISATSRYVSEDWVLKTTTAGNGGNSPGVLYAPTAVSNRPTVNIGVLRWTTFTTAGTWTLPTSAQTLSPSVVLARLQEAANEYLQGLATKANLASPSLSGTPTAPTATALTNTTQIATCAWVLSNLANSAPAMDSGAGSGGVQNWFSRYDHVHPTDTSRAPLNSPALTGTPTAPTAAAGTNNTQIATTAFVLANQAAPQSGGASLTAVNIFTQKQFIQGGSNTNNGVAPAHTLNLGDQDTGLNWEFDGQIQAVANGSIVFNWNSTGVSFGGSKTLSMGSWTVLNGYDVGQIRLWGTTYGFSITTNQINYIAQSGSTHRWWSGTANLMTLDSNSNLTASGNITAYSDPRLKDNVTPLEGAREIIRQLYGCRFQWNEKADFLGKQRKWDIGLLSNIVKEVLPEFVFTLKLDPADQQEGLESYDTVDYAKIVSVLISGFNDQDLVIEAQQRDINSLQSQLDGVMSRLQALEAA